MENKFLNAYKFPSAKHVVVSGDIHHFAIGTTVISIKVGMRR